MKMRERDLYLPVRDWLHADGHAVHVEIFDCDVVAVRGNELTAVELKTSNPTELAYQCHSRSLWADWIIAVMPHRPKSITLFRNYGIGLLVVAGGKVKEIVKAKRQPFHWHKKHAYRMKKLISRAAAMPHETAGLPCCAELKQQRLARAVAP